MTRGAPTTLTQPIIIVGTHRSGTTFLGNVLDRHPDVAYWEEPRHVWVWNNANTPDDTLTAAHATDRVKTHIHREFARFAHQHNKPRFAEKTPSNCLRLPFIQQVFPDARYIHIYRDGRAVVRSTIRILEDASPDRKMILARLRHTPLRDWPSLASRAWHMLAGKVLGKPMSFWGPRPPGWREWVQHDPQPLILAKQWAATVQPVLEFRQSVDPAQWIDLPYEQLVQDPASHIARALEHAHLPPSPDVQSYVDANADASRQDKWREELDETTLERMRPALEPTLARLGYAW